MKDTALADRVTKTLARSHLAQCAPAPLEAWWLASTSGRYEYATLVMFSPIGVTLTGDLILCEQSRAVIALGYHKNWWLSQLDEDYLASKFLPRGYYPEQAARDAMRAALESRRARAIEAEPARNLYDTADDVRRGNREMSELHEAYRDTLGDYMSSEHDEGSVAWLVGVHRRFRECWAELHPKAVAA